MESQILLTFKGVIIEKSTRIVDGRVLKKRREVRHVLSVGAWTLQKILQKSCNEPIIY